MKLGKKAEVESQFNWIFIIVVGAIIIIFFVGIVMKQKANTETTISETVMTDLQSIFTGGSVSTGTSQLIETPKIEIDFDCSTYSLKGVNKPMENLEVFVPTKVKGRNIITWTLDYNLPYKVTNFLYITNPEIRYIFVTNNANEIIKWNTTLPKDMNTEFVADPSSIQDKNNYKVRMIYLTGTPTTTPTNLNKLGKDLTALKIVGDTLTFYEASGTTFTQQGTTNTNSVDLPGQQLQPSLYGAIFADDITMYNCMMGKALKRAYYVSKVYAARNKNLTDYFKATNNNCKNYVYLPADFDIYVNALGNSYTTFPTTYQSQSGAITSALTTIKQKNELLLQKSCPLIY